MPTNRNVFFELARAAAAAPHKRAVVVQTKSGDGEYCYHHITFEHLIQEIEVLSAGLRRQEIAQGARVLMLVPPSIEFVALVYALFRIGAVPVFLDGGNPIDRIVALIEESQSSVIVGAPAALALRHAFPAAFETVRVAISVTGEAPGAMSYEQLRHAGGRGDRAADVAMVGDDDLSAVVFTSGSTGLPKGVEYTPRMFRATSTSPAELFGVGHDDVDLVTFPIYLLATPTLGATAIVPDIDTTRPGHADPVAVVRAISDLQVTYSFGSPAFWARVSQHCIDHGLTLPSLRYVVVGGAPVPGALVRRLTSLLPNGTCATPIGATEGAPFANIEARELLAETQPRTDAGGGVCVGRPFRDHDIRIIELTDAVIASWDEATLVPDGTIGELVISGPVVSPRYFRRDEATRRAKIVDRDRRIWHRVGDCGYRDDQGRIWYCGRAAHIVHHGGQRFFPIMVEGIFYREPDIYRAALVKARRGDRGALVLCIEWSRDARGRSVPETAARVAALQQIGHRHRIPLDAVLPHECFPVDARHNSKIEYGALAAWATDQLGRAPREETAA